MGGKVETLFGKPEEIKPREIANFRLYVRIRRKSHISK
jgi:hypothetical protein